MLTLYYRPSCPYCQSVLGEVETHNIKLQLKDISLDSSLADELVREGGKRQVPFLIDTARGEKLYESSDIITYLFEHYAQKDVQKTFGGLRIHKGDDVCDTCQ